MTENEISKVVVEAAIEVHRTLGGPGLVESVYEEALAYELELRGLTVLLRVDLIVVGRVVVECKAVSTYNRVFEAQVLTYLRQLDLKLGLVINFGERLVKNGIHLTKAGRTVALAGLKLRSLVLIPELATMPPP